MQTKIVQCIQFIHYVCLQVQVLVFRGHEKGINSCCFMDNDKKILSASDDRTLRIWVRHRINVKCVMKMLKNRLLKITRTPTHDFLLLSNKSQIQSQS